MNRDRVLEQLGRQRRVVDVVALEHLDVDDEGRLLLRVEHCRRSIRNAHHVVITRGRVQRQPDTRRQVHVQDGQLGHESLGLELFGGETGELLADVDERLGELDLGRQSRRIAHALEMLLLLLVLMGAVLLVLVGCGKLLIVVVAGVVVVVVVVVVRLLVARAVVVEGATAHEIADGQLQIGDAGRAERRAVARRGRDGGGGGGGQRQGRVVHIEDDARGGCVAACAIVARLELLRMANMMMM